MKTGDLIRRSPDANFGGDMFTSWEYTRGKLPTHVGRFPPDAIGIVLEVIDGRAVENMNRYYYAQGVKVIVGEIVGWVDGSALEAISEHSHPSMVE